jgi:hypothetical protein
LTLLKNKTQREVHAHSAERSDGARLLARHAREHGPAEGHACVGKLAQGTLCKILNEQEIKPHKVRYYLERRDPEFKQKMAEVGPVAHSDGGPGRWWRPIGSTRPHDLIRIWKSMN